MADLRYLKQRHRTWYFALAVPVAVRGKFLSSGRNGHGGKPLTKIVESLGTQSLKEAQDRRWILVHEWRERFKRTLADVPLTVAEIEFEAREIYTSLLSGWQPRRSAASTQATLSFRPMARRSCSRPNKPQLM